MIELPLQAVHPTKIKHLFTVCRPSCCDQR
jgi:hypothetical protein